MIIVAEEYALGDFQLKALGWKMGVAQYHPDDGGQRGRLELDGRQVDRDGDVLGPVRRLGAGRAQHPFADLVDQADFLRERDELDRADRPALRMFPADQGLEPGHLFARGVDAGLVDEVQLSVLERDPEVRFHQLPLARGVVHLGLEEAEAALAGGLGGIKCEVGVAHQVVGGAVVIIRRHDSHRCADRHGSAVERVGPRQAVDDPLRQLRQLGLVRGGGKHDLELVAAEASDLSRLADHVAETQRHQPQQCVAGGVPERIVDDLEAVEIEQEHRATKLAPDGAHQRIVECPAKRLAVGEPGQRVLAREPVELDFRLAHLGQVGGESAESEETPDLVVHRPARDRPPRLVLGLGANDQVLEGDMRG